MKVWASPVYVLEANSGRKYYAGEKFAGTWDIMEIIIGINEFSVDMPNWYL